MEILELILTQWIVYETTGKKEPYKNTSGNIDQILVFQMDKLI